MQFRNNDTPTFEPRLEPLFDAMKAGKTISSVTLMYGTMNKNNRSKDTITRNFKATDYTAGLQNSYEGEKFDFVHIDASDCNGFYMNWVVKFEI